MPPDNPKLQEASLKATAAAIYLEARLRDFEASLLVGSRDELDLARQAVMSATEAHLDAKQAVSFILMQGMGMDPWTRPNSKP